MIILHWKFPHMTTWGTPMPWEKFVEIYPDPELSLDRYRANGMMYKIVDGEETLVDMSHDRR